MAMLQSFNVLAINLSILHYFDGQAKLFSYFCFSKTIWNVYKSI